jgi:hypothetical protein
MQQVVGHFIPALLDSLRAGLDCAGCDAAVAVSVGGDAYAGASHPAAGGARAQAGLQPGAGAGNTGNATSVSITADGNATADAASGAIGGAATTADAGGSDVPVQDLSVAGHRVRHAVEDLLSGLLDANGSATHAVQLSSCGPSLCIAGGSAAAEVATTQGPAGREIVASIALGGTAHAALPQPAAGTCSAGSGQPGAASSVAIAVHGDAQATVHIPTSTDCPSSTQTAQPLAGASTAASRAAGSGATGNALSVALTAHGPASARATSGDSGQVSTGGASGTGANDTELARSGITGAAVGVAIAKLGATSIVRSGDSGKATAICSGCGSGQGGASYTNSISGSTGLSFVLAIAGRQAFVQSQSGDSGEAISWVVDRTGEPAITSSPATGTSGAVRTNHGGQVVVSGQSGQTGNVIVVAVGPDSSVQVWSDSGHSGPVHSIATWGLGTCRAEIATFEVVCDPPRGDGTTGGHAGSGTGSGTGTQLGHVKIVISPGDAGGPHSAAAAAPNPGTTGPVATSGNPVSDSPDTYTGKYVPAAARQRSRDAANLVRRVALIAGAAILPTLLLLWWVISRGDGEAWPNTSRVRRAEIDDR